MAQVKRTGSSSRLDDKLLAVLHLLTRMSGERDLGALLDLIAHEAARLVDADRATIFILDRERNELWSRVATGSDETLRFDARLGIAGTAVSTGQVVNVADADRDRRFHDSIDQATGYRTRSLLAVPFRDHGGDLNGVFEVLNKSDGSSFDSDDELLVSALATHAGIAIETVQLLEQLAQRQDRLLEENSQLWREVEARTATDRIVGRSGEIRGIVRLIEQISGADVDVLITGESGTGKEVVARAIHYSSPRLRQPLVALNCAALPDTLVESELFGIEKGVATGVDSRRGKLEAADGGTLFLDEIGDLSLASQAKILRALQERVVERVGSHRAIPVNVRVLAATNKDLQDEIEAGRFRSDLFYRLNVVHLRLPSLRRIAEDIPLLVEHFLRRYGDPATPHRVSQAAMQVLSSYRWPGNVRQLENEVRWLLATCRRFLIEPEDLSAAVREGGAPDGTLGGGSIEVPREVSLATTVAALERRLLADALAATSGNQKRAAELLGLSRQGLINKVKRYGLPHG